MDGWENLFERSWQILWGIVYFDRMRKKSRCPKGAAAFRYFSRSLIHIVNLNQSITPS